MKIGITSNGFVRLGQDRYQKMKEFGFSTLDYREAFGKALHDIDYKGSFSFEVEPSR